jgi:hypothetical protein
MTFRELFTRIWYDAPRTSLAHPLYETFPQIISANFLERRKSEVQI